MTHSLNSMPAFRKLLLVAGVVALLLAFFWYQGSHRNDDGLLNFSGRTMGTSWNLSLVAQTPETPTENLQADIQSLLDHLDHDIFSTWSDTSDITRFNRAEVPAQVEVSEEMLEVTGLAREIHEITAGAFDPTIAPLVNLWGFGPEFREESIPSERAIAEARAKLGFDEVSISENPSLLGKRREITLDYSAIAKGYAVDQVAIYLETRGFQHFLMEVGGEILVSGQRAEGRPWRIGIETPESGPRSVYQSISNRGEHLAVAGSGDYRIFFELDGQRYSHEIDPATGWPVSHNLVSATVIHDNVATADALATALMIMGPEKGMELAAGRGLAIYLIMRADSGYQVLYSDAFAPYLHNPDSQPDTESGS